MNNPKTMRRRKIYWLVVGLAALIWVIVRVVPRPSRAAYPCMRVAMSLASGMLLQIAGIVLSLFSFKKASESLKASKYRVAALLFLAALIAPTFFTSDIETAHANFTTAAHIGSRPIGDAKGIFPGRVVWVHDPAATKKNFDPSAYDHGWFLNENSNQVAIDKMLSDCIQALTGQTSDSEAWRSIFRYHNNTRGKGEVGYQTSERIFIKINATSSWSGNINPADFSKVKNQSYGISETSPQLVLSVLRQLIHTAGVPESNIWVGDPLRHIYKHCYDIWHSEFPNVHYLDHDGWNQREKVVPSATAIIRYSDRGSILHTGTSSDASAGTPVIEDRLYTIFEDAEYLINIPMLKGHKHAGITAFAKNHFGSQTRDAASHLHNGLVAPEAGNPRRQGYGLYRVQVDLLGHRLLGVKNLFYLMDALWATDYELDPPVKWKMPPFNNDWMSSIFASFDPVAIESVGFDFLREEFTASRGLATYPQMGGVDDYLHQAADSTAWPKGIVYDPEQDGIPIPSLGTHEHWNDGSDKQYSRNLGTGNGIELLRLERATQVTDDMMTTVRSFELYPPYPNPFNPATTIRYSIAKASNATLKVYNARGQEVTVLASGYHAAGTYIVSFDGSGLASGVYFCHLQTDGFVDTKKLVLLK